MEETTTTETSSSPAPETKSAPKIHPPILALALLVGGLLLHLMMPEPRVVGWHDLFGILLTSGGVGLCFYAAAIFQARGTTKDPYGQPSEFVVQAPWTFTRNPMYLGIVVTLTGFAFFFESIVMLLAPAVFFSVIDRMVIPNEEATMETRFGQAYLDYKQRVRRWI